MTAAVPTSRTPASRKSVAAALALGALGAALVLLAGGRTWSEGTAAAERGISMAQQASGQEVTALPDALAVVGLAALVAVFAVRGAGRRLVAGLLVMSGAGVVGAAVTGLSDTTALEEKAAKVAGLTRASIDDVGHTAWPWVAVAGGVLLFLAGLLALRFGSQWPAMSGRYERSDAPAPRRAKAPADPDRPEELWKALDRGEDPTGAPGR